MSSLQPPQNPTLPFDILGLIFSHYSSKETIYHPLETLLLVCRVWADAALGHQALWSHLKIYLGHKPTCRVWDVRLPLRLDRAGPNTPLDIDLRNYLDMPHCPLSLKDVQNNDEFNHKPCHRGGDELCDCCITARATAHRALEQLTGTSGEICARWRSFKLNLGHSEDGMRGIPMVASALSYPTPLLTTLTLNNIQFDDDVSMPLLPNTPLLQKVTIVDCTLPSLPPFGNVRQAVIGWKENVEDFDDLSAFRQAIRVQKLHLYIPAGAEICVPDQLLDLAELCITGNNFPPELYRSEMPILSHLTLEYKYENLVSHILICKGFAPERLRHFTLHWELPAHLKPGYIMDNFSSIEKFLARARNLEFITAGNQILNILLKVMWQFAESGPLPGCEFEVSRFAGVCIINSTPEEHVHLRGDETPQQLGKIANDWGLVPLHDPMPQFISSLQVQAASLALLQRRE